jgi:hypothetical protein
MAHNAAGPQFAFFIHIVAKYLNRSLKATRFQEYALPGVPDVEQRTQLSNSRHTLDHASRFPLIRLDPIRIGATSF